LGVALDRHGDSAAALQQFQQAVSLQPNYAAAHCNLANGLARQGRFEVAIAHYRQALQIEPGMAAAQANLIDALAALGKSEAAIAECEQALALAETHGQSGLAALLSQKLRSLRSTPAAAQPR
jgi:tetratricopeptide (TPR) repeat protein